ncbi:MAG TPA: TetR family transcriptional regulator [Pseudonocardiaceae bacterium]|jgi:AcrR family transcriptional regulator|nr:TetR family transcriptional regulator [Pseudonocardiaceae bacterium]
MSLGTKSFSATERSRPTRAAFTASGYDGVGVREIAAGAGVTAMLVNRYFGSKEQLFAEAVDTSFADLLAQLSGPDAGARSELALGVIAGTWLMRKVIGTPALAAMSDTALAARLEDVFRLLYSPD